MSVISTRLKEEKDKGNLDFKKWLLAILQIEMLLLIFFIVFVLLFIGIVLIYSAVDSSSMTDGKMGLSIG